MARKSIYETQVKPYIKQIEEMAKNGLSQSQIASQLKVNLRTLARYIEEEQELADAIYSGRQVAIKELENALFKSALGYTETLKKGMKVKKIKYANGKKEAEVEVVEPYEEQIHVKSDTQAGIFLLKNWASDRYASDPQMIALKKKEQEFKEKMAELDEDDDFDIFS